MTSIIPQTSALYNRDPAQAISELEKVFGKIPDRLKHEYVDEQSHTHDDFTELIQKRAPIVVPTQVTGLLLNSYISPITHFLLPVRYAPETKNVRWTEVSFDNAYAPEVEQEGVARLYSHNKTERGARLVRRGMAVMAQTDFFLSPDGREKWNMQIKQLATILQVTNEYEAIVELLQSNLIGHRSASQLNGPSNAITGGDATRNPWQRLNQQRKWFGIVNKAPDSRGFAEMCTNLITTMKRQGVNPDAIVVPPNLIQYYYGTSEDLWNYNSAGPQALKNRSEATEPGPENGIRLQEFMGLKVVDTYVQRMTNGQTNNALDLLTLPKQVGGFNPMLSENFLKDSSSIRNFKGKNRNIKIFNDEQGRLVEVKFEDAIRNCLRWEADGKLLDAHDYVQGEDMFKFKPTNRPGVEERCLFWHQVETKWLSGEAARNVAYSVVSKFDPSSIQSINRAIETLSNFPYDAEGNFIDGKIPLARIGSVNQGDPGFQEAAKNKHAALRYEARRIVNIVFGPVDSTLRLGENNVVDFIQRGFDVISTFKNTNVTSQIESSTHSWNEIISGMDCSEKVALFSFLCTQIHRDSLVSLHKADIYLPFDFVLCRPWITFNVSSAIIMKSGRETGEIILGNQRFMFTSNVSNRTLYANYMYYSKAVLYNRKNVLVAPDVYIQNYVSGGNTTFVTDDDLTTISENSGIAGRSSSVLSFMIPVNDDVVSGNALDIRGSSPGMYIPGRRPDAPHFSTSAYYNTILNIDPLSVSQVMDISNYEDTDVRPNTLCFLDTTYNSNGELIYDNVGHLGPDLERRARIAQLTTAV